MQSFTSSRRRGSRATVLLAVITTLSAVSLPHSHTAAQDTSKPGAGASHRPLILAHYMPWYAARPFGDRWGWHWTMNRFDPEKLTDGRREIASKFYPVIGPYDSGDPQVLEYHLLLMKLAGIDGVIVDWYGLSGFRDYGELNRNTTRVLQQCERLKMKFVICYEDQTIPALVDGGRITADQRVSHAAGEITWLSRYWFKSPAYVKHEGRPVMLSFGHNGLTSDEWKQCVEQLEFPVAWFSQDIRRPGAVGGFGWPAPRAGMQQVDRFLELSEKWPAAIPAAFPRFEDIYLEAGVGDGFPRLDDNNGRTFRTTLVKAVHSQTPIVQLATWNDWGEGTQIEPSREFGHRDLEFVQKLRRERIESGFAPQPSDLELPGRILQLRQTENLDQARIDEIVAFITAGRLSEARATLAAFLLEVRTR